LTDVVYLEARWLTYAARMPQSPHYVRGGLPILGQPEHDRSDDRRATPVRKLRGKRTDAAEHTLDKDDLPCDGSVNEHRAMRSDPWYPKARAQLVADRIRQLHGLVRGHDRNLRGGAERTIRLRPVQPHTLTNTRGINTFPHGIDHACTITVRNDARVCHPEPEPAAALLRIAGVDTGEADTHAHLAGAESGRGHLTHLEHLRRCSLSLIPSCEHDHTSAPTQTPRLGRYCSPVGSNPTPAAVIVKIGVVEGNP
jgi:hypothetical protein